MKLKDSYFIDCSNATKSGIVDYVFERRPKYLLLDELDKLSRNDQTFLLSLIETGIVSETKYNKTRTVHGRASVYTTSNNDDSIIAPLQARFFVVKDCKRILISRTSNRSLYTGCHCTETE